MVGLLCLETGGGFVFLREEGKVLLAMQRGKGAACVAEVGKGAACIAVRINRE